MSDYKTDDEKVEELKAWWKENGTSVMVGVALSIVALFGWDYWKSWKANTAAEASALYTQTSKTAKADLVKALPDVQKLQNDYASTPYAVIASLQTAQQYAEKGDYEAAVTALKWVIDHSKDEGFTQLANIRLARVLLAMKKPDDALKIVNQTYPAAYQSLLEELKGDIYATQNKLKEAREAYEKAISSTEGGSTELIQMKRDNLGAG
ncbi:MAG: hypothetical protein RI964_3040 [Pseudomonadota bacterium]|jgi:predicted negative regulator of RcsB-dependent stress response